MSRNAKRIIIIAIYLTIIGLIGYWFWSANRAPASCSDGKKNQNEQDVDCGGVCGACEQVISTQNLQIEKVTLITGGQGLYDVIAQIKNPNVIYGAKNIPYEVILKDADGLEIERIASTSLILPNQSRYIAQIGIPAEKVPARAELIIGADVEWVKFTGYEDPDFVVDGNRFGLVENGINYAQAFGVVHNRSNFDFQNVRVTVVLKDARDRIIAANKTTMGDFEASRSRDFNLTWPQKFPGTLASMDVDVEVDVYDAQNFIKAFAPGNTGAARRR